MWYRTPGAPTDSPLNLAVCVYLISLLHSFISSLLFLVRIISRVTFPSLFISLLIPTPATPTYVASCPCLQYHSFPVSLATHALHCFFSPSLTPPGIPPCPRPGAPALVLQITGRRSGWRGVLKAGREAPSRPQGRDPPPLVSISRVTYRCWIGGYWFLQSVPCWSGVFTSVAST